MDSNGEGGCKGEFSEKPDTRGILPRIPREREDEDVKDGEREREGGANDSKRKRKKGDGRRNRQAYKLVQL